MTTRALPDPLVPPEVDLRDFGFMPLHVQRLRDSELVDLSTGNEFKAAVLLWAYAWHQQPAASLPNDDRILAARSGAGVGWRKVKAMALRGFIECSDGRLYHPLIAEAALDAWERRETYQTSQATKETRQQRWRAELSRLSGLLRDAGVTPPQRPTKAQLLSLCETHGVDVFVDGHVDDSETRRDAGEIAKTGTGTGTETKEQGRASGPPRPNARDAEEKPGPESPAPEVNGHDPTRAGLACRAMRKAGLQATNPGDPRLIALCEQGATDDEFAGLAAEAVEKGKGFAWVLVALQARRAEAAAIALAPPPAEDPDAWLRTRSGVINRACQLGIGPWDEVAAHVGTGPSWGAYRQSVIEAAARQGATA